VKLTLKRLKKLGAWITLIALCWLIYLGNSIWKFGNKDHSHGSDCIIVLGAGVSGEEPSPVFVERIRHGVSLHQKGTADYLIFTGGIGENATLSEAEAASRLAIKWGVSPSKILKDTQSKTTRENLLQAQTLMRKTNLSSAIIVSDPLHLKRASIMAKDLGLVSMTSATSTSRYRSAQTKSEFLLRELFFYHYYLLTGN